MKMHTERWQIIAPKTHCEQSARIPRVLVVKNGVICVGWNGRPQDVERSNRLTPMAPASNPVLYCLNMNLPSLSGWGARTRTRQRWGWRIKTARGEKLRGGYAVNLYSHTHPPRSTVT